MAKNQNKSALDNMKNKIQNNETTIQCGTFRLPDLKTQNEVLAKRFCEEFERANALEERDANLKDFLEKVKYIQLSDDTAIWKHDGKWFVSDRPFYLESLEQVIFRQKEIF